MKMGESLVVFFGRIKALINELIELGGELGEEYLKITVTSMLRQPYRGWAEEKMDREKEITLEELIGYLIGKQRKEKGEVVTEAAFMGEANTDRNGSGNGTGAGRGNSSGNTAGGRSGNRGEGNSKQGEGEG